MDDKKYTVIGSKLVFDATQYPDLITKENEGFKQNIIVKRPQFSVEMRYFTVDMIPRPQTSQQLESREVQGSFRIERLKSVEKLRELEDDTPVNTVSSESFHSCHSTISFQEDKPKNTSKGERNTAYSSNETGKPKSIPDEELLQQLTMVNAIFLNNSVGECFHGKHSKKAHQESRGRETNRSKKSSNVGLHPFKSSNQQNVFNPEFFACHIDRTSGLDYVNNICGDNVSTKPFFDGFTYSSPENNPPGWLHKTFNPTMSVSNPRHPECKPIDLSSNLSYKSDNNNSQVPESKITFRKRKHTILKTSVGKRGGKMNKVKTSQTSPTCNGHSTPDSFEYRLKSIAEKSKQPINQAEEIQFVEPTYLNNSSVVIHPESNLSSKITRHEHKSYFVGDSKVDKSFRNKSVVSQPKIIKITENNILKTPESSETKTCAKLNNLHSISESEEYINYFKEDIGDVLPNSYTGHSKVDDADGIILQTTKPFPKPDELYFEYQPAFVEDSTRYKSQLSVIEEEEDVESVESHSSIDDIEDDYCLTDTNGRPIHLFDSRGLPLTDGRGRPLKSVQRKIIMKCDRNGIPVVENCSIFDMFGHQPHEEHFDPSRAPKAPVCSKLYTSDGRPLLLYDVEGRPLTSVSGTMLTDSSGRGLVRLTTNMKAV